VLIEPRLANWITAGLALYKAEPLMIEQIFFDSSQTGWPQFAAPGTVVDLEKLWLPGEYVGGRLRWSGQDFPILSNTTQSLTVAGDPGSLPNVENLPYQIIPPVVDGLATLLQRETFTALTAFAQVPTEMPCFTIRLEKDEQAETYLGEALEHYAVDGIEFDLRSQAITGSYLISIWTLNRESTLWLYAWLVNYFQNSLPMFTTWGLYDVGVSGSDLDPQLQYLAERVYARHCLLTATRVERAVTTRSVEWVSSFCVKVLAHYAQFRETVPTMGR
jgi:hypothetical protein